MKYLANISILLFSLISMHSFAISPILKFKVLSEKIGFATYKIVGDDYTDRDFTQLVGTLNNCFEVILDEFGGAVEWRVSPEKKTTLYLSFMII